MQYSIPSVISLDSSKMHFFKNQATCDPATILNGQELAPNNSALDCGFVTGANEVQICLSDSVDDPSQFEGLILADPFGGEMVIQNCTLGGSSMDCDGAGVAYTCTGVNSINNCVFTISCPDGTLISECQTLALGCFGPQS